jgi:hypothetical protein
MSYIDALIKKIEESKVEKFQSAGMVDTDPPMSEAERLAAQRRPNFEYSQTDMWGTKELDFFDNRPFNANSAFQQYKRGLDYNSYSENPFPKADFYEDIKIKNAPTSPETTDDTQTQKSLSEILAERSGDSNAALSGLLLSQKGLFSKALGTAGIAGKVAGLGQQVLAGLSSGKEANRLQAERMRRMNERNNNLTNLAANQNQGQRIGSFQEGGNVKPSLWQTIQSKRQGVPKMQEGGDVTEAVINNEITQEVNPLELQQQPQAQTKEIEVEKGEYLKDPNNNIVKVEDKSENGHDKGGVRIEAEGGTKVLSNFLKLDALSKKELKELSEKLKVKLSGKETYAKAMDKFMNKIGVNEKREEQEKLAKELERVDKEQGNRDKDITTKEMNTLLVGNKMQKIEEDISETQGQQKEGFDEIYDAQELAKVQESFDGEKLSTDDGDINIYQEGGEFFTDNDEKSLKAFQNWAKKNNFSSIEKINNYFKKGGCVTMKKK